MKKLLKLTGVLVVLMALLVACGGGDAGNGNGDSGDTESNGDAQQADEPATATPFPTFAFVAPTNPPIFNQSAEETEEAVEATEEAEVEAEAEMETVELDETMVSRGLGRYEALDCAVCHGEAGVGTDEVEGLLDYSGSQDEFITFMRTGGTIGNSHQYSTNRLSANGAQNLYQYVLSISQGE